MENNNIGKYSRLDGERITIEREWYESLIEFRTKYITLINFLLDRAELRSDNTLSIYTNVADMLCALEHLKTRSKLCDLIQEKGEEE